MRNAKIENSIGCEFLRNSLILSPPAMIGVALHLTLAVIFDFTESARTYVREMCVIFTRCCRRRAAITGVN